MKNHHALRKSSRPRPAVRGLLFATWALIAIPVLLFATSAGSQAQTAPTSAPTTSSTAPIRPTTRVALTQGSPAYGVEKKLSNTVAALVWEKKQLGAAFDNLAATANINLVVNWPALAQIGLTRETEIDFRARGVTVENAIRLLLEGLSNDKGRLNYSVSEDDDNGGGVVEISTMANFGRSRHIHFFPARALMKVVMEGASINADGLPRPKPEVFIEVLEREITAAGEPSKNGQFTYDERSGRLMFTGSARGLEIAERTIATMTNPVRPPAATGRSMVWPAAKKTEDALTAKITMPAREHTLEDFAAYLADVGKIQVTVMPNTAAPEEKHLVGGDEATVAATLDAVTKNFDATWETYRDGTVVIARKQQLEWHAVLGAYDVRDVIKTLSKDGGVSKAAATLERLVKANVEGSPTVEIVDGILTFRASPAAHRKFAKEFDKMWKTPK